MSVVCCVVSGIDILIETVIRSDANSGQGGRKAIRLGRNSGSAVGEKVVEGGVCGR